MYNYSISKKHVNMIEIILERSNQLVIQLNSLASVPTPLGRTCINRRSVQTGHSTLSPGNPVWPELTVYIIIIWCLIIPVTESCYWCCRDSPIGKCKPHPNNYFVPNGTYCVAGICNGQVIWCAKRDTWWGGYTLSSINMGPPISHTQ